MEARLKELKKRLGWLSWIRINNLIWHADRDTPLLVGDNIGKFDIKTTWMGAGKLSLEVAAQKRVWNRSSTVKCDLDAQIYFDINYGESLPLLATNRTVTYKEWRDNPRWVDDAADYWELCESVNQAEVYQVVRSFMPEMIQRNVLVHFSEGERHS